MIDLGRYNWFLLDAISGGDFGVEGEKMRVVGRRRRREVRERGITEKGGKKEENLGRGGEEKKKLRKDVGDGALARRLAEAKVGVS